MIFILINARPSDKILYGMKDYNNIIDYDPDDNTYQSLDDDESSERKLRSLNQIPEWVYFMYRKKSFRQ